MSNLTRFIARKFTRGNKSQRFLNFARFVALISVVLGSMALIISLSVLNGFETLLRDKAVKFTSHITINSEENGLLPYNSNIVDDIRKKFPQITAIAPVIKREGLIKSKSFIEGVLIHSMTADFDITNLKQNIKQGSLKFSGADAKEIVIGERLASKLNVKLNDTIILFTSQVTRDTGIAYPEIEKFKITGIYQTGMAKYDDIIVYVPFEQTAKFFKLPENSVTSYDVMTSNIDSVKYTSSELQKYLGRPCVCLTVFQLHGSIFAWIELQKVPIPLVLGLISIVAVFNILTILLITVVEKTHSIGILRALGMNNKGILSIFITQGVIIGLAGTVIGCGLGLLFGILQQNFNLITLKGENYFLDSLPICFSMWHFVIVIGSSLLLSLLATLIPSWLALRVPPVKAIRYR